MNYLDKIICITLDNCIKRKNNFEKEFKNLNIPYEFFIVKKHLKGGIYGCFDSHIKIIQDVYNKGLNNVLIFEDDAYPTKSFSIENFQKAINYFKQNKNCECLFLGYLIIGCNNNLNFHFFSNKINHNIIKFNPLGTHAYIINRNGMKKILNNYKKCIGLCHYDKFLCKFTKLNNFCFIPMLFDQNYNLDYNIEALNIIEFILRKLYPLLNFIKIHYNSSLITYYRSYFFIIIIIIILLYLIYRNGGTRFYL